MASFWRENQLVQTKKKEKKFKGKSSWFREPKCKLRFIVHFFIYLFFSLFLKNPCYSNFVKMEGMLQIENIFESTLALPFLTNSRVDMVGFVNLHKVVAKRSAFSALPSAPNGGENKKLKKP
jgi:hypothetical protein